MMDRSPLRNERRIESASPETGGSVSRVIPQEGSSAEGAHIFAVYENHWPLYKSIIAAEARRGNEVRIGWLDKRENNRRGLLRNVWKVIRSPQPTQRVYIEEFFQLVDLLFLWLVSVLVPKIQFFICIHNLNRWLLLEYKPSLRRVSMYIARSMLIARAKEIIVVSEAMKKYGSNMCGFKKEFRVMSFRQPTPAHVERMNPAAKLLTIPAGIDENRRDYLTVISACTQVAREGKRFQLVLLGKCSPETLSTALSHALDEFAREFPGMLITFLDYVSKETFEAYMAASTCLIANLVPYVHAKDGTTEVSGVSKESGTRSLADERDILCLKPHELPPGERPRNYLSYGSAEELAELLRNLL